jgi:hypothetical protein
MDILMENTVLFSPLGRSDPTRGNFDGAFLHILRHRRPLKAYLYMTREIFDYSQYDKAKYRGKDRYQTLGERVCPACKFYDVSPEKKVENPQKFNSFYSQFRGILDRIHQENPDARILVNLSSGTPAMKAALELLCFLSELPLEAVQVDTPAGKGNSSPVVEKEYDLEQEWKELNDNYPDIMAHVNPGTKTVMDGDPTCRPKCRCRTLGGNDYRNQYTLFAQYNARRLIGNYDYHAAEQVLKNAHLLSGKLETYLEIAVNRLELKSGRAQELCKKAGISLLPVVNAGAREAFEYILYLQVKVKRNEITEFARGVSPVLTELSAAYLSNVFHLDVHKLCRQDKNGVYKFTRGMLQEYGFLKIYDDDFGRDFKDGSPLALSTMMPLLRDQCGKNSRLEDLEQIKQLRSFEADVRNKAAHQIVGITDDDLRKIFGFCSEDILKLLHDFCRKAYPQFSSQMQWDSYEIMNNQLFSLLSI